MNKRTIKTVDAAADEEIATYSARGQAQGREYEAAILQYIRELLWKKVRKERKPEEACRILKGIMDAQKAKTKVPAKPGRGNNDLTALLDAVTGPIQD